MILQFFPRVIPVRDNIFQTNTLGMLEIFPKPTGITVYSHPTTISTHAVKDEFISEGPEYDHTGFKLLVHDDGCECLIISNAMRGGYKQIGLQSRDPYTRRNNPAYVPPNARNPPRPWSVRLKEPRLRPIEICYTRAGMVNAFLGKEGNKVVTRNIRMEEVGGPAFVPTRSLSSLHRATEPEYTLKRGRLDLNPSEIPCTQDFVSNVYITLWRTWKGPKNHPFSAKYPSSRMLGAEFIQNYSKTPLPETITFPASASMFLPPPIPPTTQKYENVFNYEEDQAKTYPVVYLSPDCITRYDEWVDPQFTDAVVPTAREFPMDWLVVVAQFTDRPIGEGPSPYPPVLFVPHILAFHPRNDGEGPIDIRTGRRLCNGDCLMAYLTTSPVKTMFPADTSFSLLLFQISRPITNAPLFTPPVDLAKLLGIDVGDDQRLAKEYEDDMVAEAMEEEKKHELIVGRRNTLKQWEEEEITK